MPASPRSLFLATNLKFRFLPRGNDFRFIFVVCSLRSLANVMSAESDSQGINGRAQAER
jgi:hypothetical protein